MRSIFFLMWMLVFVLPGVMGEESFAQGKLDGEEIEIEKVEVRVTSQGPVVLLKVGPKAIPIYVDPTVAGSIQGVLSGHVFPRPLSHDLMHTILNAYSVRVDRVFISLKNGIFYGKMTLSLNGQSKIFDSRSSDAIALAIHFHTPIVVSRELLQSAGKPLAEPDDRQVQL